MLTGGRRGMTSGKLCFYCKKPIDWDNTMNHKNNRHMANVPDEKSKSFCDMICYHRYIADGREQKEYAQYLRLKKKFEGRVIGNG